MIIPVGEILATPAIKESFLTPEQKQSVVDVWGEYKELNQHTPHHCLKVAYFNWRFAHLLGGDPQIWALSGLLHDLGKTDPQIRELLVGDDSLNAADRKDHLERLKLGHVVQGVAKLKAKNLDFSSDVCNAVLQHHMNFSSEDMGYPARPLGAEISLIARVTAIGDRFDAMQEDRGYAKPLTSEQARERILEHMELGQGKLDPGLKPAFEHIFESYSQNGLGKQPINYYANIIEDVLGLEKGILALEY